jgi:AraC-like DNA-binding protein
MFYTTYTPGSPISKFVDYFWLFAGGQAPRKERIVPSGTLELVFNLRCDEIRIQDREQTDQPRCFSGAVLSGPYSSLFVVDAMQHESMLGVHFKPGGAFPFLGALASELTDAHANLTDLWGRSGADLRERLCGVSTHRERFRILEKVLTDHLRGARNGHLAVARALNGFGPYGIGASVREVARDVGICQRRFSKVFADQVGLTPKVFCRILRFQRVRTLASQCEKPDWVRIASACGYFDQSHLINDFREFSGSSPSEYLRRLRQHLQDGRLKDHHVPVPG